MKQIILLLLFIQITFITRAQEFDVYYLSVASAHYEKENIPDGYESFDDINGARRSSRYVHELFSNKSNGKGSMLRSEAGKPVTKTMIVREIKAMIKLAKKSKAKNPLLLFYYCGHGISEGIAWNQFLVPGDFNKKPKNLSNDPLALDLDKLSSELLYLGEITDLFSESGIQYMCLIDACYEGKEEKFSVLENYLSTTATQNFKDIASVLRFMNEYRTNNPVVFATMPGTTTKVTIDPLFPEGTSIGPLCRKLMLIGEKLEKLETLSMMDVVMLLSDPEFDTNEETRKVMSNYEFDSKGLFTLLKQKQ
ncbi:hypothetical protein [Winogradskyella sp. 3972H.M.0a.05]|uniref:hypothetical protein n=1 Tax=Winogradskyella sp. 3972H.M.0a.05 TaxID=2950277 RepID=UPI0033908B95